jgi:hypothetical protein
VEHPRLFLLFLLTPSFSVFATPEFKKSRIHFSSGPLLKNEYFIFPKKRKGFREEEKTGVMYRTLTCSDLFRVSPTYQLM